MWVLLAGLFKRHAIFFTQRNGADIRGEIPYAAVADAGLVFTHALNYRGRPRLFFDFVLENPRS